MFFKIGVLKNFATLLKQTPTQVVSCEYCEIFKNTIFYRTPPVAASVGIASYLGITLLKDTENKKFCCCLLSLFEFEL